MDKKLILVVVAVVLVAQLGACVVYSYESKWDYCPPKPDKRTVYRVVSYEYFDCSDDTIIVLEREFFDPSERYAILFIARKANVDVHYVITRYRVRRSLYLVAVEDCRLSHDVFFVHMPTTVVIRETHPCGRAYVHYRSGTLHSYTMSNAEVTATVDMHILVNYCGFEHQQAIELREKKNCIDITVEHHEKIGCGRRNIKGHTIKRTERPWETTKRNDRPTYNPPPRYNDHKDKYEPKKENRPNLPPPSKEDKKDKFEPKKETHRPIPDSKKKENDKFEPKKEDRPNRPPKDDKKDKYESKKDNDRHDNIKKDKRDDDKQKRENDSKKDSRPNQNNKEKKDNNDKKKRSNIEDKKPKDNPDRVSKKVAKIDRKEEKKKISMPASVINNKKENKRKNK